MWYHNLSVHETLSHFRLTKTGTDMIDAVKFSRNFHGKHGSPFEVWRNFSACTDRLATPTGGQKQLVFYDSQVSDSSSQPDMVKVTVYFYPGKLRAQINMAACCKLAVKVQRQFLDKV